MRAPRPRSRGRLDPAAARRSRSRRRGPRRRARAVDGVARRYAHAVVRRTVTSLLFPVALACATLPAALAAPAGGEGAGPLPEVDFAAPSLSEPGRALTEASTLDQAPRYALAADLDPKTGDVAGRLRADLPAPTDGELHFRVFAGLLGNGARPSVDDVAVDGEAVDAQLDVSLLTVPVAAGGDSGDRVEVSMRFSYRLPEVETGTDILGGLGEGLDPAEVGLLARHRGGATLGHWFPVWLPPTASAEPEPDGFGDIGNFPAAIFRVSVTVPDGWEVVSGGVNVERGGDGDRVAFVEEGTGLRDFAVFAGRERATDELDAGDAAVRVTAPRSAGDEIGRVGDEARASLLAFAEDFGPYPWTELDVVSVPLGSSVAGMEWPGMIWIESTMFAGGLPGLGDLGDLEDLGLGDLEDLGLPGLEGFDSMREFVVAHEVAHQWWHALVGNDSISAPVVDEPLAQFSACLYFEREHPDDDGAACALQTDGQYQTMRALGEADAPADQPSDAFTSSLQYGGVVYGKAPGFYRALGELVGADAVVAGLEAFVAAHAFGVAGPDDLRAAFAEAAPGRSAEIDALWLRWIDEAHGDEDIGAGSLPGLDPGQIDPGQIDELLELLEELSPGGR